MAQPVRSSIARTQPSMHNCSMAGWLHGVFVGEWLFVFPLCGFSLSLFVTTNAAPIPWPSHMHVLQLDHTSTALASTAPLTLEHNARSAHAS